MGFLQYIRDFWSLFFPPCCVGCDQPLVHQEEHLCTECWYHLPYTHAHKHADNPVMRKLWGKADIVFAAAYLLFLQSSRTQRLIHHIKYRNRPELATHLGERYGALLSDVPTLRGVDIIIPVPLHRQKLRKRGYNQSDYFARGLSNALQAPILTDCLVRHRGSGSQTRKGRFDRHENVQQSFSLATPETLSGKHVLLVDDVLTTGATIEACANVLLAVPGVRVSVVTLAVAL